MIPWRARLAGWRNALLSDPRFQRWAASFPLTRPVAHREAARLFDLVAGFVYAQVLAAAVHLRLFDLLANGPRGVGDLAAAMDVPRESAVRLLDASVALRLLDRVGPDLYVLGPAGAAFRGNAGLSAMVAHHALLYADLADPVAFLRRGRGGGELAAFWPYAGADASADVTSVAGYSRLMAASQPMIASDILSAYPFRRHRCLLDVGGGEGAFLEAVATRAPALKLMLFDLPSVAARARERLAGVEAVGGDMRRDPLPRGADIISLVRVLHDHDDDVALEILRAVRAALPRDGVALVAEPMSRAPARDPMASAYFGFYLMAMGRGRVRQPTEYMSLFRAAGFRSARAWPARTPMLVRVLTARV